jgi:hypothetical protein
LPSALDFAYGRAGNVGLGAIFRASRGLCVFRRRRCPRDSLRSLNALYGRPTRSPPPDLDHSGNQDVFAEPLGDRPQQRLITPRSQGRILRIRARIVVSANRVQHLLNRDRLQHRDDRADVTYVWPVDEITMGSVEQFLEQLDVFNRGGL